MADRSLYFMVVFLLLVVGFSDKDFVLGLDKDLALTPQTRVSYRSSFLQAALSFKDTIKNIFGILSFPFCCKWAGWTERFRCNIDCNKDPNNCISKRLILQMANRLAEDGYRDVGYKYVSIDTFASWGVDYLKVDGCFSNPFTFDVGYPKFSQALNATGRPILLSCEWSDYQAIFGIKPDYAAIAKTCKTWRNYIDVQDSWGSVLGILDHFAQNQDTFIKVAGPGQWNDPDMFAEKGLEIWSRALSDGSVAVVLFNHNTNEPEEIKADFSLVGLMSPTASARDLFAHRDLGKFTKSYSTEVKPLAVVMVKLTPVRGLF